jgi:hypothetical protein
MGVSHRSARRGISGVTLRASRSSRTLRRAGVGMLARRNDQEVGSRVSLAALERAKDGTPFVSVAPKRSKSGLVIVLVWKHMPENVGRPPRSKAWARSPSQDRVEALGYSMLPDTIVQRELEAIGRITKNRLSSSFRPSNFDSNCSLPKGLADHDRSLPSHQCQSSLS